MVEGDAPDGPLLVMIGKVLAEIVEAHAADSTSQYCRFVFHGSRLSRSSAGMTDRA